MQPQQEVLSALLDILAARGLISGPLCSRAKQRICSAPDIPAFFRQEDDRGAP